MRIFKKDEMTNYVPFTLNEILDKIRLNRNKSRTASKKNGKCYSLYNKKYKDLDYEKQFFRAAEVEEAVGDSYFKGFRRLKMDKELRPTKSGYTKHNVESICLLKEVAGFLEDKFLVKRQKLTKKKRKQKTKIKKIPYYYDSVYRDKIYICHIPETLKWKIELVSDFLKNKQYIFDEDSSFGKPVDEIRYFIAKCLINTKVERWDYNFKRFMSKSIK